MTNELITTGEAAAVIGVDGSRVRRWALAGRLHGHRYSHGWLFDPATVQTFAQIPRKAGRPRKEVSQ